MNGSLSVAALRAVPSVFWPAMSPSGSSLVFYREMNSQCEISIVDCDSGTTTSLPTDLSLSPSDRIVWDRAEEWLYVHHSETDAEQTDISALDFGGTAHPVIGRKGRCWHWDVSPDNRSLLYSHRHPDAALWESPRTLYRYDRDAGIHTTHP